MTLGTLGVGGLVGWIEHGFLFDFDLFFCLYYSRLGVSGGFSFRSGPVFIIVRQINQFLLLHQQIIKILLYQPKEINIVRTLMADKLIASQIGYLFRYRLSINQSKLNLQSKNNFMQSDFSNKEIVWAKVKGYPWWPAQIAKLPSPDNNVFKVVFIAEDTHAYLNPRDVKKYSEFYDECSKKKMRGLGSAIQAADQLFKKRSDSIVKDNRIANKCEPKSQAKTKQIKKRNKKKPRQQSDGQGQQLQKIEEQVSQQIPNQKIVEPIEQNQQQVFSEQEEASQQENSSEQQSISEERFLNESSQKVDRTKIDTIQEEIYRFLEQIRQRNYHFSIEHYTKITFDNLTDEQLLQSKITNMLSFIIHELKKQFCFPENSKETPKDHHFVKQREELKILMNIHKKLKQRIINYLNDTSYYDQYLRLIQKNKKNRHDYQSRLVYYLKQSYKIKKQLAQIFATRLMSQINNGAIIKSKQLLEDLRQRKIQMGSVNNRAVIDRIIESMTSKYT